MHIHEETVFYKKLRNYPTAYRSSPGVGGVCVAQLVSFLCCFVLFVCPVSCVPYVANGSDCPFIVCLYKVVYLCYVHPTSGKN